MGLGGPPVELVHSFGAIVFNSHGEVLVLWERSWWGFPKGRPQAQEAPCETAARDTLEETGAPVSAIRRQAKGEY
eukprot:12374676-Alexandrium_andersonii.AAC.1